MWNRMRKNSTVHFETKNETENSESEFYFFYFSSFVRVHESWNMFVACDVCSTHSFFVYTYIYRFLMYMRRNGMDRERKVIYIHLRGDDEEGEQARKRERKANEWGEMCVWCAIISTKKNFFISNPTSNVVEAPHERKREWNVMGERRNFLFLLFLFYFFQLALTFTIRRFFIFHVYHTQPTESREGKITAKYVARRKKKKQKEKRKTYIAHTHTASQTHTT